MKQVADTPKNQRSWVIISCLATLLTLGFAQLSTAGQQSQIGIYDVNVGHGLTFTGRKNDAPAPLAMRGYDPVSYFTDGKPLPGELEFSSVQGGAIYRFASAEHQRMFEANPYQYLPQYGGFCAFGVTQQTKFDGDPEIWNIHKGKLYLNVTPDLQKKWLSGIDGQIASADRIWPQIAKGKPQNLFESWLSRQ